MRKIISFTHATLNGYIDDPHEWAFQYSDGALQDYGLEMTLAADSLLLGRITYEGMAEAWPTAGNPFADHVNSITKYVVASQPVDTMAWDRPCHRLSDLVDPGQPTEQAHSGTLLDLGHRPADRRTRRGRPARRVPDLHLPRHHRGRRALFRPRQHRHRRAPRHHDLCHRRRGPRRPPRLSPLTRTEPPDEQPNTHRDGRARAQPRDGPRARWISSSTALGSVVSKSISLAHVGVTTMRTMPS